MKRVMIGPTAFKCSASGFDVTTATGNQLTFDAFANRPYNGVYLAGVKATADMTSGSDVAGPYIQGVVNFGKTFAAQPQCIVRVADRNDLNFLARDYWQAKTNADAVTRYIITRSTLTVRYYSTIGIKMAFVYCVMQF